MGWSSLNHMRPGPEAATPAGRLGPGHKAPTYESRRRAGSGPGLYRPASGRGIKARPTRVACLPSRPSVGCAEPKVPTMQTHPTRREFLQVGASAVSAFLVPMRARAWKNIPIGTQLWCVRQQLATDIPGTLNALSAIGFNAVELENAFKKPGPEWRQYLDAAKLKPCGFHHRLDELQGDKLAATIEFNQAIGNRNLIIRSLPPDTYKSGDLLKKTADAVNEIAAKV